MKRLGLITNPSAGNGFGKLAGQVAVAQLQRECEVLDLTGETKAQSEANSQEAINQGLLDGLVVVGGDGAVQQGVNLCVAADIPLGIIAAGTGNDAARTLGLPIRDAVAGAGVLLNNIQKPRVVDVVRAKTSTRELYFFGSTNADFGALVNMRANSWKWPKGPSRYKLAMVVELAKFKPTKYSAIIDGVEKNFEAMLCTIANSQYFGGGMKFAPNALIDDGYLDIFIVNKISRLELLRVFPKVYTGEHITHPAVEFIRAKNITLSTATPMPAFADGEPVGMAPVRAEIAPKALKVYATSARTSSVAD